MSRYLILLALFMGMVYYSAAMSVRSKRLSKGSVEKGNPQAEHHKRELHKHVIQYDKRLLHKHVIEHDKRELHKHVIPHDKRAVALDASGGSYYYLQNPATAQVTYYYTYPDGTVRQLQPGETIPTVQYQQPTIQVQQPVVQTSSGFRPFAALKNIVQHVGDTASNIVSLPFAVVDEAIEGVGLGNTAVGNLAEGILDVGEAVLQAPVQLVSNVGQAPFAAASYLTGGHEE